MAVLETKLLAFSNFGLQVHLHVRAIKIFFISILEQN